MAQVLLLLSLSFGAIIVLGCALVLLDDRLEGSQHRQDQASTRSHFRRFRLGLAARRSRTVPGQKLAAPREIGYEPQLFPARSPRVSAR